VSQLGDQRDPEHAPVGALHQGVLGSVLLAQPPEADAASGPVSLVQVDLEAAVSNKLH